MREMGVYFSLNYLRFKVEGMKDPTRIDEILRAVRNAWAGQPDLTLPTLMAMAANQGIGWGSSDEELIGYLESIAQNYPPEITPDDLADGGGFMLTMMDKGLRISLVDSHVIVRSHPSHQTVVWEFDSFRTTGPGFPLVITDTAGIDHRLGITERITRLEPDSKRAVLKGLSRADMGDAVYVIVTEDGRTVTLSRRVEVASADRRSLEVSHYQWYRVISHAPLTVELAGGERLELGTPTKVLLAET